MARLYLTYIIIGVVANHICFIAVGLDAEKVLDTCDQEAKDRRIFQQLILCILFRISMLYIFKYAVPSIRLAARWLIYCYSSGSVVYILSTYTIDIW